MAGNDLNGLVVAGAAVVTPDKVLRPGFVRIDGERISQVGEGRPPRDVLVGSAVLEVAEWVVPGFIDIHVHGGDGAQVNADREDEVIAQLEQIARFHALHGTTSLLATTVSDSPERLATSVAGVAAMRHRRTRAGSRVVGAHVEGPWLSQHKRGAQPPAALRQPALDELHALARASPETIRLLTVAPELSGAMELIRVAVEEGIRVSIGHTAADFDTTVAAFEAGARHVTHLFNAMSPLHHRQPGPVAAALLDERVTLEVVADLEHLHPAVIRLVHRFAPGRIVAVTDAGAAAGLPAGEYRLGPLRVASEDGRVTLAGEPGTLAGSTITMDIAFRNLVEVVGLSLTEAVRATSTTPAMAIGLDDVGAIRPGALADLALLGRGYLCVGTVIGGHLSRPVPDPGSAPRADGS